MWQNKISEKATRRIDTVLGFSKWFSAYVGCKNSYNLLRGNDKKTFRWEGKDPI